jgi:hypothetical protein
LKIAPTLISLSKHPIKNNLFNHRSKKATLRDSCFLGMILNGEAIWDKIQSKKDVNIKAYVSLL